MNTKTITRFGLLTAVALVLGYFERFIPIATTLPGIKLGLANTILLYAIYMMNNKSALCLMLLKVMLSGMLFAGMSGALYSLSGGLLSLIMMLIVKSQRGVSIIGVSVVGAVFHNVGQILAASMIVQSRGVFLYLPALLIAAVITGMLTGITAKYVLKGLSINYSPIKITKKKTEITNCEDSEKFLHIGL